MEEEREERERQAELAAEREELQQQRQHQHQSSVATDVQGQQNDLSHEEIDFPPTPSSSSDTSSSDSGSSDGSIMNVTEVKLSDGEVITEQKAYSHYVTIQPELYKLFTDFNEPFDEQKLIDIYRFSRILLAMFNTKRIN